MKFNATTIKARKGANMRSVLARAVTAILAGASAAAPAIADNSAQSDGDLLQEITVTAQRRSQKMQDVPIAMQAFTSEALQQLNVTTFDDYVKYLPNVTTANSGPGQNEVFMRGLSAGTSQTQGSGSFGLWPNVAIYIDNQSGQLPGRNLDIYAADLERIEVLEGPQGTLFGAGAQAGVIRYITNQPKLNTTEGSVKAGYGVTAHGDPNADLTAVINLPLITDKMAVRAVIYNDRRGGYIDNVPSTFTRKNSDIGIHYANFPAVNGICPDGQPNAGFCVPPGTSSISNSNIARRAINPATYTGIRAQLLYKFNDDWDLLLSQSFQNLNTDGVFYQQPASSDGAPLQPLEVTLYNDTHAKDRFESTAWTVSGRLGDLRAVYTGGYLVRNVSQVGDYTNYARGVYADYYQCYGANVDASGAAKCYSPSAAWVSSERNTHQQHELRITTPDEWRLRGIVGAFWEANTLYDQTDWRYRTVPTCTSTITTGCFAAIGTIPGTTVENPGIQSDNSSFYQDTFRETKQLAFFASADFDIIPQVLTLTLGTRHFKFDNSSAGNLTSSFGCFEAGTPATGCHDPNYSYNLDAQALKSSESGFRSRGNLTWHITPDVMIYYTFSQGFRPGGFNQNGGSLHAYDSNGVPQFAVPRIFTSDKLNNSELGWKTEFLGHRLQWNGAIYRENWNNVQVPFFNPGIVGNIIFNTNGQNFLIKGIETSLVARVVPGLTLQGSAAWNQSRQTNSPQLLVTNPANPNVGKPLTEVCDSTGSNCSAVTNLFGPIGSPSANAPPLQFSLRARYDWTFSDDFRPFIQLAATHTGHSFTQAGANPTIQQAGSVTTTRLRFEIPAYTTYDASVGIAKDPWNATIFCQNLTNSNASNYINTNQFIVAETPLRPRVLGLSFGYRF